MKFYVRCMSALLCITFLVSCASGPPKEELPVPVILMEKGYVIGEKVTRVRNYRLHGWNYVDDRNLILQGGVSNYYLVLLRHSCRELENSITLGFTSTIGSLSDRDKLIVKSPGGYTETCFIEGIWELEKIKKEQDSG